MIDPQRRSWAKQQRPMNRATRRAAHRRVEALVRDLAAVRAHAYDAEGLIALLEHADDECPRLARWLRRRVARHLDWDYVRARSITHAVWHRGDWQRHADDLRQTGLDLGEQPLVRLLTAIAHAEDELLKVQQREQQTTHTRRRPPIGL
jgi:hypothetical protein